MKKNLSSKKEQQAILRFIENNKFLASVIAIMLFSFVIFIFSQVMDFLENTAEYWTPAFAVASVILCALAIFYIRTKESRKISAEQQRLDRIIISSKFFQRFFYKHPQLPLDLEKLSGVGEYQSRIESYSYNRLCIFKLRLADMSCGEKIAPQRLKLFHKQIYSSVFDFLNDCEFALPKVSNLIPLQITRCYYDIEENSVVIEFTFVTNYLELYDFRNYTANCK